MDKAPHLKAVKGRSNKNRSLPRQLQLVCDKSVQAIVASFSEFLDGLDDKLFDLADMAVEAERNRLLDAMREVRIQRSAIETGFHQALVSNFRSLGQAPSNDEGNKEKPNLEDLTLVHDDELEINVALENMARRARGDCSEQLKVLNHRIEYLFEGRISVDEKNGPLEPRQIGNAFQQCADKLELDIRTRLVLLKLFEREVLENAGALISEANQQLMDAGVLPEMKTVPIAPRRKRRPNDGGQQASLGGSGGDSEKMFGMLQELLSAMHSMHVAPGSSAASPAAAAQTGGMAVMQNGIAHVGGVPVAPGTAVHSVSSDDLLSVLNRLQRVEQSLVGEDGQLGEANVREDLSSMLDAEHEGELHALEQADDDVINLVSMLFDFILDDQALPTAIKAMVGRLQIPLLKIAISDKNFFADDSHPARQMLNVLAKAGAQWSPDQGTSDPLYQLVEKTVHHVLDDYDLDPALFSTLLEEVESSMRQQSQQGERVEARVREVEEGRAQAEEVGLAVEAELNKRLQGRSLPSIAERILRGAWYEVLRLTWLREGADSESWEKRLKVADAVVWSLLDHRDETALERLRSLSPRLITSLDQGLLAINFDAVERQKLLNELRQAHMALLQGQTVQRGKSELVATADAEEQPEGDLLPDSQLIKQMSELVNGQWLQLGEGDEGRRCKLVANIREGDKLIFVNRRGIKVAEFSARELAEKVQQQEAKLLESGALFDRALQSLIGDMRRLSH